MSNDKVLRLRLKIGCFSVEHSYVRRRVSRRRAIRPCVVRKAGVLQHSPTERDAPPNRVKQIHRPSGFSKPWGS